MVKYMENMKNTHQIPKDDIYELKLQKIFVHRIELDLCE